jgi:HNH endonuclease
VQRDSVPVEIKRAVLVEAGHRCAIPTCRATTTEIAHIVPWAKSFDNSFENLIALCPNCHTRFDQKKEIDHLAVKMYKQNLGILNNRYGEFERRLFEFLAKSDERVFVLGVGGDLLVANAVKDGFFEGKQVDGMKVEVYDLSNSDGFKKSFPMMFTYWVTDAGVDFIKRFSQGADIA